MVPIRVRQVFQGMNRGGAESMIMNLYRQMDRSQIQFDFLVHTGQPCDYDDEIQALGGKIFHAPRYRIVNHESYCRWLHRFFDAHPEYRIIHGHQYSIASVYLAVAKQHGLIKQVHLVGYRTDVAELYKAADICCFPSIREGLGLAALEGMAAGLPLIASDNRGTRDYAVNGINGFICRPNDICAFANAIDILSEDEQLCRTMSAENRSAAERYSNVQVLPAMGRLYSNFGENHGFNRESISSKA